MTNPIRYITDSIEELWSRLTLERWTNGFDLGHSLAERRAWREALEVLTAKASEAAAFQQTAKNKETRAAADGMVLGYQMAVEALRAEIATRDLGLIPFTAEFDKEFNDVD